MFLLTIYQKVIVKNIISLVINPLKQGVKNFLASDLATEIKHRFLSHIVTAMLAVALGILVGQMLASGNWPVALVLVAISPAALFIHEYPYAAVLAWLLIQPFFVNAPDAATRMVYWGVHRGLPLGTIIVIILSEVLRAKRHNLPKMGVAELSMFVYISVSVVSLIYLSPNPKAMFYRYYDRVLIPLSLYLLTRLTTLRKEDVKRLIAVMSFICISQTIVGLMSWFAPNLLREEWINLLGSRTVGTLFTPAPFGATLICAGMFVFQGIVNLKEGHKRTLYLIAYMLSLLSVFISFSRANWLGGIVATLPLVILHPQIVIRVIIIAIPVMSVLAAGPMSHQMSWAGERLYSDEAEKSADSRKPVAVAAYRMFQLKPFFGWGYANFDVYDFQFYERVDNVVVKDHASHNTFLTIVAEQGAIGTISYLLPFFWWLKETLRALPKMPAKGLLNRNLVIMLWGVLGGFVIIMNFSDMGSVFSLGIWWMTLGFIANLVHPYLQPTATAHHHTIARE